MLYLIGADVHHLHGVTSSNVMSPFICIRVWIHIHNKLLHLLYYVVLSPCISVCVHVLGKLWNNRSTAQSVCKLSRHGCIHIPYKCIDHAPSGACGFLYTCGLPAYTCPSTWSRVVRQEQPWHGFMFRKHWLVQLRSKYCTQQEDSNLNVPIYNGSTEMVKTTRKTENKMER